jgi:uncharacterized protein (DUF2236 family)
MMWQINSEQVLLFGGRAALLMQLAHPSVAAAVAEHSNFRDDPLGRLRRTIGTMQGIIFGDLDRSARLIAHVNGRHERVVGSTPGGGNYRATDPELLMWVYSTLVTSSVNVYRALVRALDDDEITRYYEETRLLAGLFGIPDTVLPGTLGELETWMDERIESGTVTVTPLARELAAPILRPLRFVPLRVAVAAAPGTIALLHPRIREGYGLRLSAPASLLVGAGAVATRRLLPLMPGHLRRFPEARAAVV